MYVGMYHIYIIWRYLLKFNLLLFIYVRIKYLFIVLLSVLYVVQTQIKHSIKKLKFIRVANCFREELTATNVLKLIVKNGFAVWMQIIFVFI